MKALFTLGISFDTVTQESAEEGDSADYGWSQEPAHASLRECLQAVKNMGGIDYHDGASFYPCDGSVDYRTGEVTRESVHVQPLTEAAERAWEKVLKMEGLA